MPFPCYSYGIKFLHNFYKVTLNFQSTWFDSREIIFHVSGRTKFNFSVTCQCSAPSGRGPSAPTARPSSSAQRREPGSVEGCGKWTEPPGWEKIANTRLKVDGDFFPRYLYRNRLLQDCSLLDNSTKHLKSNRFEIHYQSRLALKAHDGS